MSSRYHFPGKSTSSKPRHATRTKSKPSSHKHSSHRSPPSRPSTSSKSHSSHAVKPRRTAVKSGYDNVGSYFFYTPGSKGKHEEGSTSVRRSRRPSLRSPFARPLEDEDRLGKKKKQVEQPKEKKEEKKKKHRIHWL